MHHENCFTSLCETLRSVKRETEKTTHSLCYRVDHSPLHLRKRLTQRGRNELWLLDSCTLSFQLPLQVHCILIQKPFDESTNIRVFEIYKTTTIHLPTKLTPRPVSPSNSTHIPQVPANSVGVHRLMTPFEQNDYGGGGVWR